jgi:hypothetical protein
MSKLSIQIDGGIIMLSKRMTFLIFLLALIAGVFMAAKAVFLEDDRPR